MSSASWQYPNGKKSLIFFLPDHERTPLFFFINGCLPFSKPQQSGVIKIENWAKEGCLILEISLAEVEQN